MERNSKARARTFVNEIRSRWQRSSNNFRIFPQNNNEWLKNPIEIVCSNCAFLETEPTRRAKIKGFFWSGSSSKKAARQTRYRLDHQQAGCSFLQNCRQKRRFSVPFNIFPRFQTSRLLQLLLLGSLQNDVGMRCAWCAPQGKLMVLKLCYLINAWQMQKKSAMCPSVPLKLSLSARSRT